MGQFIQWTGSQIMGSGLAQIWPGMPVNEPLFKGDKVVGVRLVDQGIEKSGKQTAAYLPGMDIYAGLTVVGDGPVGPVGEQLNRKLGMRKAIIFANGLSAMKAVVELPENTTLEPGLVIHTFGYPEPGIFGFLYVYPNRLASLGILFLQAG